MGNSVCQRFHVGRVVCPSMSNIFITAAVDNIDHNPSATTAKDLFHGTGISLIQHPTSAIKGVHGGSVIIGSNTCSKTVSFLPHFYTDVPPVTSNVKLSALLTTNVISLAWEKYKKHTDGWRMQDMYWKKMLNLRMYHGLHTMQSIRNPKTKS